MNVHKCEGTLAGFYWTVSTNYTYITQHKICTPYMETQLPSTFNNMYILQFIHYNSTLLQNIHHMPRHRSS